MLRTHSSSLAMSVSSSHGFTSNRSDDLAMRAGSSRRQSSSEPNRSMSSSSSSAAAGAEPEVGLFTPGRLTARKR
uniref:Uncharacterized protein n=2 Tax=Poecilia TaxID=8080 RepID=A0A3B3U1J8_9TELE